MSSLIERVGENLWLLGICRDVSTLRALKHGPSEPEALTGDPECRAPFGSLNLRGLPRPVLFRPSATDLFVAWELFHHREYECSAGWPFKTVVDCGANVGMFLAWTLRAGKYGLEQYVGVEPNADAFRTLCAQTNSLGASDLVTLIQAAAWDRDGSVSFDDSGPSWSNRVSDGGARSVRALTLGSILDDAGLDRCDLLKLDIEGGERCVLPSIEQHAPRIDTIVAELHDGLDYAWFAEIVSRAGYIPSPPGQLFRGHPGAVRRGSAFEGLVRETIVISETRH